MEQVRYSISDASKQVEVEPHVLRKWEEELGLSIPRNAVGHRYYTEAELKKLRGIKQLKSQGFQLKSIRIALPSLERIEQLPPEIRDHLCEELNKKIQEQEQTDIVLHTELKLDKRKLEGEQNWKKLKESMTVMIKTAIEESNRELAHQVSKEVTTNMTKELNYQFRLQEQQQEEHFRKIDEALRERQKKKKKSFWFVK